MIDEVAIYNRALTANEVADSYRADFWGKRVSHPFFTSPTRLADGVAGVAHADQLATILGTTPVTFSLVDGVLPAGVTLAPSGALSGTPSSVQGTYSFTVVAADAAGRSTEQLCLLPIWERVQAPDGLLAWWRGENDAQDAAGTHHGALRGGTAFGAGRVGQAFKLDGIDDNIEIPDAPALRPASLTLEAWVAFDAAADVCVIAKPLGASTLDSYVLRLQSGYLWGGVNGGQLAAPFSLQPGRWYHLAFTFDNASKQHALYVDGGQVASLNRNITIAYDAQPVLLGRATEFGVPKSFLHGRIDEAAIYDRALSSAEIVSIFQAGPAGKRS